MKISRVLFGMSCLVVAEAAQASDGLQLIGYSLSQMQVAGAVTANPQSPITVLTNPAGLHYVTDQTEFSTSFAFPDVRARFNAAGNEAKSSKDFQLLPSVAVSAPMKDPRTRFGFAVGLTAGAGTAFSWPTLGRSAFSDLQILKIAPGMSVRISKKVVVGGAVHLSIGRVSIANQGFGASTLPQSLGNGSEMLGLGGSVGVMVDANDNLRLGAAYTTKTNFPDAKYSSPAGDYSGHFNFPQQASIGAHINPNKPLSFSVDGKWINYRSTLKDLWIYGPGLGSGVNLATDWRDQYVLAVAAQYNNQHGTTYSVGFNHCNTPFTRENTSRNILLPAVAQNHLTFGVNSKLTDRWSLSTVIVYQPKSSITDGTTTITNANFTAGFGATVRF